MELSGGRAGARTARKHAYLVQPTRDAETIRALLEPRRLYAAYALGQLEPDLFPMTEWWTAKGDTGRGLVLFARGGLGNAIFTMGDAEAVAAVLHLHTGPRITYATYQPDHLAVIEQHFFPAIDVVMSRMAVSADTFRPAAPRQGSVGRLRERHLRALNRLYSAEGTPSYYNSSHLAEGVYYGVFVSDLLVAVAGTHVVAPHERIAVVGNVFTHPEYRGNGFATAATSAVTKDLLRTCRDVVLTVDPANAPAVRAYRRLGYEHVSSIMESAAVRKEPLGVLSFARRRIASWRGRRHGGEIVYTS